MLIAFPNGNCIECLLRYKLLFEIILFKLSLTFKRRYSISSNKRPQYLFNFEAYRCGAYWSMALKRGRPLTLKKEESLI